MYHCNKKYREEYFSKLEFFMLKLPTKASCYLDLMALRSAYIINKANNTDKLIPNDIYFHSTYHLENDGILTETGMDSH